MLEALLPKQGEELTLTLGENVVSITVDSVSVSSAGFVDSAVVTLPDGQNSIMKLQMKGELVWRLLGVEQEHTISLPN